MSEILEKPASWTQGRYAKDDYGIPVTSTNPAAVCFCLRGAIQKSYDDPRESIHAADLFRYYCRQELHARSFWTGNLVSFNDSPKTTHAEVLSLVRAVEERLQAEGVPLECQ